MWETVLSEITGAPDRRERAGRRSTTTAWWRRATRAASPGSAGSALPSRSAGTARSTTRSSPTRSATTGDAIIRPVAAPGIRIRPIRTSAGTSTTTGSISPPTRCSCRRCDYDVMSYCHPAVDEHLHVHGGDDLPRGAPGDRRRGRRGARAGAGAPRLGADGRRRARCSSRPSKWSRARSSPRGRAPTRSRASTTGARRSSRTPSPALEIADALNRRAQLRLHDPALAVRRDATEHAPPRRPRPRGAPRRRRRGGRNARGQLAARPP